MNWLSAFFARQVAAVVILVLLVGTVTTFAVQAFVEPSRSRSDDIAMLNSELAGLRTAAERESLIHRRQAEVLGRLRGLSAFWAGPSRTQIAAAMEDILRTAAQQAQGRIVSASVLDGTRATGNTLAVRARITGTLATLQHVLITIQTVKPLLFVDSLVVTVASEASTSVHPQELSFELSAIGYLATGDLAKL